MKKDALTGGTLDKLISLCLLENEPNVVVRTNAIWAIKNITYQSEFVVKQQILERLGKEIFYEWFHQEDGSIKSQALNLIRNALCGNSEEIAFVLNFLGEKPFIAMLVQMFSLKQDVLTEQCIFILVNILNGDDRNRNLFIQQQNRPILEEIGNLLLHPAAEIRKGALWAIYNLTCGDEGSVLVRVNLMKSLQFDFKITNLMLHENEPTVMDMAKKAIVKFQ